MTRTIILEVDEKWYDALGRVTEHVYPGEVCRWYSVSEPHPSKVDDGMEEDDNA